MWRDWFKDHKKCDNIEEMYQMFKDRMEAESRGEILEHTPQELSDMCEAEEQDEHYDKYLKNRHYRKLHATQMGYKFNDHPYDPNRKYK